MEHREALSPASSARSPTIDGGQYGIGESSTLFDSNNRQPPTVQPHSQPETGSASLEQSCNDNAQEQTTSDPHDGVIRRYFSEVLAPLHIPSSTRTRTSSASQKPAKKAIDYEAAKCRLIANSALQREQERSFFEFPTLSSDVDLDGLSSPLARHLLDLYWSNCHLEWILSYRPSIMGSLLEDGLHFNRILLNALYFSGSWYSSQVELRSDAADRTSTGLRFYSRICHLLTEEDDTSSLSTALGLLICSMSLVYRGKADAAWVLSGIANRMLVLDAGSRAVGHIHYHNDPGSNNLVKPRRPIDDLEEEQRKRLYLGAFSIDEFLSIFLGHAPTFDQDFIDTIEPLLDNYEDFDDWTPYADSLMPNEPVDVPKMNCSSYAVSTGVALIELLKIWHQVMYVFYGRVGKQDVKVAQECRASVENKLHQWTESLPTHLRFDRLAYSARPPHQISLW